MKSSISLNIVSITSVFITCCSCAGFLNLSRNNTKCIDKCKNEQSITVQIECISNAIRQNPTCSEYYSLRGSLYKEILKFTSAIQDFRKVIELEPGNVEAYYCLAAAASLASHKQYALYWLQRSFEAGFENYQVIETDKSFDNLRGMDEFNTLLKKWCQKPVSLN